MPCILLVDDNPDSRDIYRTILEYHGFGVVLAGDGVQALRLARERLPCLILMDISMPMIDGLEATRTLKADARTAAIPVVALTAHAHSEDRDAAFDAGYDAYLAKPVEPLRVVEEVRRWLRARVP